MTLVYITIAWTLGIALARQFSPSLYLLGGLTAVGLIGAICTRRAVEERLAAVLALAVLLGGWRYVLSQPVLDDNSLAYYNDSGRVSVRGHISAEPSIRDTYTQLEVSVEEIVQNDLKHEVHGKLVLNIPHYPEYEYGDLLHISGLLETPPILDDFSYKEYLASRGVHSLMRRAEVTGLSQRQGSLLLRYTIRLKRAARKVIESILPNPDAGLLSGILLGLGHTLPDRLSQAFRTTGLTHIIVISGFNISLVSGAVMLSARRLLHRWVALLVSLMVIALYTLFVGPSPPVVRAALMGCLFALGWLAGRRSHALTSLAATSLMMTAFNPLLVWSVSFQLSFAATLALIVLEPVLARNVRSWITSRVGGDRAARWTRLLRDILLTTVAAQIATLPIIYAHFEEVSIISLLANILVLPVQPAIMLFGSIATFLGGLWRPIGSVAAWLVWPFLRYSIIVVQRLAQLPWASVTVPHNGSGVVWAFYGLVLSALVLARYSKPRVDLGGLLKRARTAKASILALALAALLIWAAVISLPDQRLHVYFLDVGQGDAILLRTPGGRVILVDGGPDPLLLTSHLGRILPFWQRRIDLVVATHADQDHLSGLIPVIERYKVTYVLEPPTMDDKSPLALHWHELLDSSETNRILATRGTRVTLGDQLLLQVLHPPADAVRSAETDDNRNSLVLIVSMGRCRLLLTADIDTQAESDLIARGDPLRATILKVAHHGAGTSSSASLLSAVNPQVAVISVGEDNRFGHPGEAVLRRLSDIGCRVFRTDLHGTIELITDGQSCWIKTHHSPKR